MTRPSHAGPARTGLQRGLRAARRPHNSVQSSRKHLPRLPGWNTGAPWWMDPHPVYWLPQLVVFVLIVAAPRNVVDVYPWLGKLSDAVASSFPFLRSHLNHGQAAQLSYVARALSWALIPFVVSGPFLIVWGDRHRCLRAWIDAGRPDMPAWVEPSAIVMCAVFLFGHWGMPGDIASCSGCTVNTSFRIAFSNAIALVAVAILPIAAVTAFYIRIGMRFTKEEIDHE
jgi:hypothetical protein